MFGYRDYKILLCCGAMDMRKSINGLSSIVCEKFELDPNTLDEAPMAYHYRNSFSFLLLLHINKS